MGINLQTRPLQPRRAFDVIKMSVREENGDRLRRKSLAFLQDDLGGDAGIYDQRLAVLYYKVGVLTKRAALKRKDLHNLFLRAQMRRYRMDPPGSEKGRRAIENPVPIEIEPLS